MSAATLCQYVRCRAVRDDERKDREVTIPLDDPDAQLVYATSRHPQVEYVVMLQVRDGDRWRTVHLFDNAHETSEHHEHAYVGFVKQQPPIGVWRGDWRVYMHRAIVKIERGYADILRQWRTR